MVPFSAMYAILIAISISILVYNIRRKWLSNLMFMVAAIPLILIFIMVPIQSKHGSNIIGGFFENINDYETRYMADVQVPHVVSPDSQKAIVSLLRPRSNCSVLTAAYFPQKCQRETLLEMIYAPKGLTDPVYNINFEPNFCVLGDFGKLYQCVDDHSRTWNVRLLDEMAD